MTSRDSATFIETYIKLDSEFVRIEKFSGPLRDPDYIEGAIICKVSGVSILSLHQWDLVDQLWAYIVEGLLKSLAGDEYESTFPDQALRLRFQAVSGQEIRVVIGDASHCVPRTVARDVFGGGAFAFFQQMIRLAPSDRHLWDAYVSDLKQLGFPELR